MSLPESVRQPRSQCVALTTFVQASSETTLLLISPPAVCASSATTSSKVCTWALANMPPHACRSAQGWNGHNLVVLAV